jgi:hypothetical protein
MEVNEICAMCLDQMQDPFKTTTVCLHTFHKNCLDGWLRFKTTCPCCRALLREACIECYSCSEDDDDQSLTMYYADDIEIVHDVEDISDSDSEVD